MAHDGHKIPITILVCDADADGRTLARHALEGARVSNALRFVHDGAQLLDYLYQRGEFSGETGRAPRPGLILMDLDIPRTAGVEALQLIKADPALVDIPVVVLSTSRSDEDLIRSYGLDTRAFITKPMTLPGLLAAMNVLGGYWLKIVELSPGQREASSGR